MPHSSSSPPPSPMSTTSTRGDERPVKKITQRDLCGPLSSRPRNLFAPSFCDPSYTDTVMTQDDLGAKHVRPATMDHRRPAVLASDAAKNPSVLAKRFGIFPGRTDGRSLTSPTQTFGQRYNIRIGQTLSDYPGDQLMKGFGIYSLENFGMSMDELMAHSTLLESGVMTPDLQEVVQLYQEIITEENHQRYLFRGLTMNEMLNEGFFEMGTAPNELNNVHELFRRENWLDLTRFRASDAKYPVLFYTDHLGNTKEWDVKRNNELWAALQMPLQLASKMLASCFEVYKQHIDFRKLVPVEKDLDRRSAEAKDECPVWRTVDEPDNYAGQLPECKLLLTLGDDLLPSTGAFEYLEKNIAFSLASEHLEHTTGKMNDARYAYGWTGDLADNPGIVVAIGVEHMFPLLQPHATEIEKMAQSFQLSCTIIHEIGHAYHSAMRRWMMTYRTGDIELERAVRRASTKMFPRTSIKDPEPFFESEEQRELGFSVETHLLGGVYVNIFESCPHLDAVSTPLVFLPWPCWEMNGVPDPDKAVIRHTQSRDTWSSFVPVETYKRMFKRAFWDVFVTKYGIEALQFSAFPAPTPRLIRWSEHVRRLVRDQTDEMWHATKVIEDARFGLLKQYVDCLATEHLMPAVIAERWTLDLAAWQKTTSDELAILHLSLRLVEHERQAWVCLTSPDAGRDRERLTHGYLLGWTLLGQKYGPRPIPIESRHIARLRADTTEAVFVAALDPVMKLYPVRAVRFVQSLSCVLLREASAMQDLLTELYLSEPNCLTAILAKQPGIMGEESMRIRYDLDIAQYIVGVCASSSDTHLRSLETHCRSIATALQTCSDYVDCDPRLDDPAGWRDKLTLVSYTAKRSKLESRVLLPYAMSELLFASEDVRATVLNYCETLPADEYNLLTSFANAWTNSANLAPQSPIPATGQAPPPQTKPQNDIMKVLERILQSQLTKSEALKLEHEAGKQKERDFQKDLAELERERDQIEARLDFLAQRRRELNNERHGMKRDIRAWRQQLLRAPMRDRRQLQGLIRQTENDIQRNNNMFDALVDEQKDLGQEKDDKDAKVRETEKKFKDVEEMTLRFNDHIQNIARSMAYLRPKHLLIRSHNNAKQTVERVSREYADAIANMKTAQANFTKHAEEERVAAEWLQALRVHTKILQDAYDGTMVDVASIEAEMAAAVQAPDRLPILAGHRSMLQQQSDRAQSVLQAHLRSVEGAEQKHREVARARDRVETNLKYWKTRERTLDRMEIRAEERLAEISAKIARTVAPP